MADIAVQPGLELLDIRHFSARQLRPILELEARLWQQRLRWDYAAAVNLLLQYLDSRMLPGFVALDRGQICGFTFCVYEGKKAVVGDAFAIDNSFQQATPTTHWLLRQLLNLLRVSPDVRRIESQLLLYDAGHIAPPFDEERFATFRRLFMQLDLRRLDIPPAAPALPPGVELHQWTASDYHPTADFIRACYLGHIDAQINDQYRTTEGSLRFLHNIIQFPGCGTFDPTSSWVLRDRRTASLVGVVLCSQVRYDTAHITQLCVAPIYRNHHLGAALLRHALRKLIRSGFEAVTLTVTEANAPALTLYRALNFKTVHTFDAHVLNLG